MSTVGEASNRPANDETIDSAPPSGRAPRLQVAVLAALTAAIVAIAFVTKGGVDETVASPGNTWIEIALTLLGAGALAVALLWGAPGRRRWGWLTVGLMGLLFALQAGSIAWSVVPGSSWLGSGQMLAYLAVFAATVGLARLAPGRWPTVLGALIASSVALSAWSLLVKVFPSTLAASNQIGRLQAPFGYWNALALSAALGVPGCLWLGARRGRGRRLAGLAAPALSLLIAVLVLSASRSADLAAAIASGAWLAVVPIRLRAVAVAAVAMVGAGAITAWALTHPGVSHNNVAMSLQDHAGHTFGIVVLVVLVAMTVGGIAVTESMDRTTLDARARGRIGAALIGLLGLAVVAAILGVAASSRGLTGEIRYGWQQLTNPQGSASAVQASRVFEFGSSRPLYWHQALAVGDHNVLKGVGALGFSVAHLRYSTDPTVVLQAHSYVFETYADLGIIGLLITAALLASWLLATGRTLQWRRRTRDLDARQVAERTGLFTLAATVLAFGVQSTLDWTWYFAGVAVPALIAAGWLVGHGPAFSTAPVGLRRRVSALERPGALSLVLLLVVAAGLSSWMVWRPLHSADLINAAENSGSVRDAQAAQSADPFSLTPYAVLADLYLGGHRPALAQSALEHGIHTQPDNPYAWSQLADFDIRRRQWAAAGGPLHQVTVLDIATDPLGIHNDIEVHEVVTHINTAAAAKPKPK